MSDTKLWGDLRQRLIEESYVVRSVARLRLSKRSSQTAALISLAPLAACSSGGDSLGDAIGGGGGGGGTTPSGAGFTQVGNTFTGTANDDTLAQGASTDNLTVDGQGGNDNITTGAGADQIDGGAGNDTINGGAGNDIIRPGEGQDATDGGAGNDVFVIVGTTSAGQYTADDISNVQGTGLDLSGVLELSDLNGHSISDVIAGETIDGGAGANTVVIFGDVDLSQLELANVQVILVNSTLTVSADQLEGNGGDISSLVGDGTSVLEIVSDGGAVEVDLTSLSNLSNFNRIILGSGVTASIDTVDDLPSSLVGLSGNGTLKVVNGSADELFGVALADTLSVVDGNNIGVAGKYDATIVELADFNNAQDEEGLDLVADPSGGSIRGTRENDTITMGAGTDVATGAGGVDIFIGTAEAFAGDSILDFGGKEDVIRILSVNGQNGSNLTSSDLEVVNGRLELTDAGRTKFGLSPTDAALGVDVGGNVSVRIASNGSSADITTNALPVLEGDKTVTLPEDSSIALNIQEPTDAEGDPISVFITQVPGSGTVRKANGDVVNSGEFVSVTELAGLTYEGAPDFFGDAGDLVYTVFEQGTANSQERTVSLNVTNVNDAPVVTPITQTASEDDAPGAIDLTAGQTDVDNDALTAQNVQQTGGPNNVAFTISGNNITIDPGQFNNLPDGEEVVLEFTYDVNDGTTSVPNTLTLTVTGENDAPETDLLNVLSNEDAAQLQIDLLDGQTDPDDNETPLLTVSDLTVSVDTGENPVVFGTVGEFLLVDPAQYNYLAAGENVILTFDYNVNDASSSTANSVNITISGVNDAPDASAHADDTDEDAGIYSIDLAPLQSDPDTSNSLTISGLTRTDGRSVSHTFSGTTLSFDTNIFSDLPEGAAEDVVFEYQVSDGTTTVTRTLTITVEGREDAVTIVPNQSADVEENSPVDTVVGTVQIIDDDAPTAHSFEIFGGDHAAAFDIDALTGEITVVDASILDFEMLETTDLLIRVTDAGGNEDEEAFTVNITDVNEAPTLTHETISVLAKDLPFQMPMVRFSLEDPDAGDVLSLIVTSAIARDTGSSPRPDADVTALFENDDSVSVREDRNDFTDDEALVTTNSAYLLLDPGSANDGTLADDIEFGKRDRVTNADVIDLTVELSDSSGETKVETLTFDLLSPLLVGDLTAIGTGGNDYLVGNLAAQTMRGGGDDDILIGARIDPTALGYNPNNPLGLFEEGDQLFGGGGNDLLFARYGQSHLNGGGGNDILYSDGGAGDMRFTPGTGNNAIFAHSSGLNILDYSAALPDGTRVIVDFDTGIALQEFEVTPDVFELRNTDETFGDAGKSGINAFYGTNSDDIVKGSSGHMRVALNRGLETFAPMPYTPDTAIEVIAPNGGDDIIDGGDAFSILSYMGVAVGGATVNAGVNVNFVTGVAVDPLSGVDNFTGIEGVIGTAFDDVLIGDENGQVFEGGQGDDDIRGGSGLDENGLENVDVVRFEHILSEDMGHFTSITGTEFANVADGIALEIFSVIDRVYDDGHGDIDDIRGIERYIGTGLRDDVRVSAGEKIISFYGLGGDDVVQSLDGDFEFFAGPGDDGFEGRGTSDDLVFGMQGRDFLDGGEGADVLVGGFGLEPEIYGREDNDLIFAGGSALSIPKITTNFSMGTRNVDYDDAAITFDFTNGLQGAEDFVNAFVEQANDRSPSALAFLPSFRFGLPEELVNEAPHPTLAGRADLGADGLEVQGISGGDGNDMLVGTALGRDFLLGGLGDNIIHGGAPISLNAISYLDVDLENDLGVVLDLDGIFLDENAGVLFHALDRNFNPFALGNIAGVRDQIFFVNAFAGTNDDDILIGKDGMFETFDATVEGYQIGTSTYGPTFLQYNGANQEIFNPEFFIATGGSDVIDGDGRDFDADDFANGTRGEDILDSADGVTGFDVYIATSGTYFIGSSLVNDNGTPGDTSDDFQTNSPFGASKIFFGGSGIDSIFDVELFVGSADTDRFRGDQQDNFFFGGDGADQILSGGSLLVDDGMGGQVLDEYADMDFLVFATDTFWPGDFNVELIDQPSAGVNVNISFGTITDDGFGNTESTSDDFRGILATNHNDTITGTNAAGSEIHGFGGNDLIIGGQFDDMLLGGDDDDIINGAGGNDTVVGGNGDDSLVGLDGDDLLLGGLGSDTLIGGDGDDLMLDFADPLNVDVNTYSIHINSGAADSAADSWTHINGVDQIGTNDPLAAELEDLLGSATAQFTVGQDVLQLNDLTGSASRIGSVADFVAEYDTFSLLNARWFASVDGTAGNVIDVSFGGESALTIVLNQDVDTSLYGNNGNFNDGDAFITALGGTGSIDFT